MTINRRLVGLSTRPARYFSQPRPQMERLIPTAAARILDVGCGEGVFGLRCNPVEIAAAVLLSKVRPLALGLLPGHIASQLSEGRKQT